MVPVKDPTCDGRADVNRRCTMSTCNYVSKNGRCIAPPVAGKQHSRCARHGCPSSGCNGEKSSSDATCGRCADTDTDTEVSCHRPSYCIEPLPLPPMLPTPPTRCPHRLRGNKSDCQARRRRRISLNFAAGSLAHGLVVSGLTGGPALHEHRILHRMTRNGMPNAGDAWMHAENIQS